MADQVNFTGWVQSRLRRANAVSDDAPRRVVVSRDAPIPEELGRSRCKCRNGIFGDHRKLVVGQPKAPGAVHFERHAVSAELPQPIGVQTRRGHIRAVDEIRLRQAMPEEILRQEREILKKAATFFAKEGSR